MIQSMLWGGAQRLIETITEAAPTLLVGLFVAGVFERLLGSAATRRLFGHGTRRALPQAWLIGMLIPVCSLGVIPIIGVLKRAGLSGGTILAFAITAPLFNPLSVLYGLSLSDPLVILGFALASLAVVTVVGIAWDRVFPGKTTAEPERAPIPYGWRRMAAIGVVGARGAWGPNIAYLGLGLLGVLLLSVVLPFGALQAEMEHSNPFAALEMTGVAIPAYATPMTAMSQVGSMFAHGNSIAAAFVLLALGAGLNFGLIGWIVHHYGWKRSSIWMCCLLLTVIGFAYALDPLLYPKGIEPPGHTHAFDIYCRPFPTGDGGLAAVASNLEDEVGGHELRALGFLIALGAAGAVFAWLDRRGWRIEEVLERAPAATTRARLDVTVPGPVLGAIALVGVVGFSVLGCYSYYPPPDQIFDDLQMIRTEVAYAANLGDPDHAAVYIPLYEDWVRRLQVSVYLREGLVSPYRRMKAQVLLDKIERLEHAIEDNEPEEIERYAEAVRRAHDRLKTAFRT